MARNGRGRPGAGHDGQRLLAAETIESPYRKDEQQEVVRNLRESPAAEMLARGDIGPAQYRADAAFRRLFEHLTVPKGGVVDPSNEPVDVSGRPDPHTDRVIDAGRRLAKIAAHLGKVDYAIVTAISGEGHGVKVVAKRWEGAERPSARTQNYISRRYRDALMELAAYLGFAGQGRRRD